MCGEARKTAVVLLLLETAQLFACVILRERTASEKLGKLVAGPIEYINNRITAVVCVPSIVGGYVGFKEAASRGTMRGPDGHGGYEWLHTNTWSPL